VAPGRPDATRAVRLAPVGAGRRGWQKGLADNGVQNRILEQRADLWRIIEAGAVIFCGNANTMAPAVRRAFMDVFREQSGKAQADADAWLAGLRADDRYLEDIWGGSTASANPVPG
jgi:hypothetical protein